MSNDKFILDLFQCQEVIKTSLGVAKSLLNDVDLYILSHTAYGKGFMKSCKLSPDAYIQIALQLAYFRVSHTILFSLSFFFSNSFHSHFFLSSYSLSLFSLSSMFFFCFLSLSLHYSSYLSFFDS